MKCKDIMTKHIKSCKTNDNARDAAKLMKELDCGVIPIVNDKEELLGIVTDRDIAIHIVSEGKDANKVKLKECMTTPVITCKSDDNIDDAINTMKNKKIRRIPVVDKNNKLQGIISLGDIAVLAHEEHETFEALEKISEPV